eukprot:TRINITY_DN530_c1_g1_i3.p1 TRINITY_DN530_c1_g1~~TRINITY_DN530_c1_g1_i3.p1  ORF type:complete len:173 (+),score=5.67 TRINITY_DN530_c1_g1_i3:11-529(+)
MLEFGGCPRGLPGNRYRRESGFFFKLTTCSRAWQCYHTRYSDFHFYFFYIIGHVKVTSEHEFHALNSSPVKTMGGIKNGSPTTVEQNSISICVVSGFMVKMASWKLPRKASMTRAPDTITTPITLKFGDVWASANVNRIRPTTRSMAEMYSCSGYLRLSPGMKAPIIITGNT